MLKHPTEKRKNTQLPKRAAFDKDNVNVTSHIPLEYRDYGFMKTTNTGTPFPKKSDPLMPEMLIDRLQGVGRVANSSNTTDSQLSVDKTSDSFDKMSFEMKRKLFHEGEFTITRGKKTSEMFHPWISTIVPKSSLHDPQQNALLEMEDYCRAMNIKIMKGNE
ncbi:uncharacterized protein LOC116805462 [Drosophila grimshawi]|uniref:uncharacterized protein LOC116805462 n=1 Tax=Drosophila grimshawi TaxID=7222 RepID=UPI000C86FF0D|nr:uncharacterized protein LOC116805462 [Drosophila grimshawi]